MYAFNYSWELFTCFLAHTLHFCKSSIIDLMEISNTLKDFLIDETFIGVLQKMHSHNMSFNWNVFFETQGFTTYISLQSCCHHIKKTFIVRNVFLRWNIILWKNLELLANACTKISITLNHPMLIFWFPIGVQKIDHKLLNIINNFWHP